MDLGPKKSEVQQSQNLILLLAVAWPETPIQACPLPAVPAGLSPGASHRLSLSQVDRPIPRVDCQQASAAVQLPVNLILANLSLSRNRHVEINMAITGVEIHIRRKIAGDLQ